MIKVNEGRTLGEVLDGSWATRQFDFGSALTDLQKIHGELAYQILLSTRSGAALLPQSVGPGSNEDSAAGL